MAGRLPVNDNASANNSDSSHNGATGSGARAGGSSHSGVAGGGIRAGGSSHNGAAGGGTCAGGSGVTSGNRAGCKGAGRSDDCGDGLAYNCVLAESGGIGSVSSSSDENPRLDSLVNHALNSGLFISKSQCSGLFGGSSRGLSKHCQAVSSSRLWTNWASNPRLCAGVWLLGLALGLGLGLGLWLGLWLGVPAVDLADLAFEKAWHKTVGHQTNYKHYSGTRHVSIKKLHARLVRSWMMAVKSHLCSKDSFSKFFAGGLLHPWQLIT